MITIYFSVSKKKGSLKSNIIQDVTTAEIHPHFRRMYCIHLKSQRVSQASSKYIEVVSLILIAPSWTCASTLNMETVPLIHWKISTRLHSIASYHILTAVRISVHSIMSPVSAFSLYHSSIMSAIFSEFANRVTAVL
jgi:hypothetical protein